MKRIVSILISLVLALGLIGCKQNEAGTPNTSGSTNGMTAEEILGITSNNEKDTEQDIDENETKSLDDIIGTEPNNSTDSSNKVNETENKGETVLSDQLLSDIWEFRVIDCGQADSILLHSINSNVLIDAGEDKNAASIKRVLDDLGVKKLDLLIATHAHSDHIGGMQTIVENYDIENIVMSPQTHTTKTYENLLTAIDKKGYTINMAAPGDEYSVGDLDIEIIGPCDKYAGDLNNSSVVAVASYGNIDILLTGDAEMQSEKDYVQYLTDMDIEILKVGHHGSDTSTSSNLLNIVRPEIALISCGEGNEYGHPTQETLDKLSNHNIEVYRTDLLGDIIVRTDGTQYTVESGSGQDISPANKSENTNNNVNDTNKNANDAADKSEQYNNNQQDNLSSNMGNNDIVYVSKSGKKYHSIDTCVGLYTAREIKEITLSEAISNGMTKCSRCWDE